MSTVSERWIERLRNDPCPTDLTEEIKREGDLSGTNLDRFVTWISVHLELTEIEIRIRIRGCRPFRIIRRDLELFESYIR